MSIQDLGSIGEVVAALATLGTLIYLAMQIRQNTYSARSMSRQTLIDGWAKGQAEVGRDPELLRVIAAGAVRWHTLSNLEKTQFDICMGQFLGNLQNGILLHRDGMLDQKTLDTTAYFMLSIILCEGGSQWWEETNFAWPETREYLDERLAESRDLPPPATEIAPYWFAMSEDE